MNKKSKNTGESTEKKLAVSNQVTEVIENKVPVTDKPMNTRPPSVIEQLLTMAVDKDMDADKLGKLLEFKREFDKDEAKKAYVVAMNAFKQEALKITKNKEVSFGQTHYKHSTLDHICDIVTPFLCKHGLSHTWETNTVDKVITVTCVITHIMGHSERTTLSAPSDTSGAKNSIQAIGSAVTYLQRYTFLSAFGLAASNQDDDGAKSEEEQVHLSEQAINDFIQRISMTQSEKAAKKIGLEASEACTAVNDLSAYQTIRNALADHLKLIASAAETEL